MYSAAKLYVARTSPQILIFMLLETSYYLHRPTIINSNEEVAIVLVKCLPELGEPLDAPVIVNGSNLEGTIGLANPLPKLEQRLNRPDIINANNQLAIPVVKKPIVHTRTTHINLCDHSMKELIANGGLTFDYISTMDMILEGLAKLFTPEEIA